MNKYLSFIIISVLALSGCSIQNSQDRLTSVREITLQEINNFIPVNYSAIKDITGIVNIKKVNTTYLLPIKQDKGEYGYAEYNGSIGNAKIIILNYNSKSDSYEKTNEYFPTSSNNEIGFDDITDFDNYFDIDKDGEKDFFASFQSSGVSGSSTTLVILKYQDNQLIELGNIPIGEYKFNSQTNEIISANYIWDFNANEVRYDCHYYQINKYQFNGQKFGLITTKKSARRYSNDSNILYGECDNSKQFASSLDELLIIENFY